MILAVFLLPACAAWSFAGCGNSGSDPDDTPDATADASTDAPTFPDAAPKVDGETSETGTVTGGNCSPVDSPICDVVLNNCPASEAGVTGECLPGNGDASATCTFELPSQHLPPGHTCCPSDTDQPCLSGSECQGDPCVDGGTPTARCSPRCCDDSTCGSSPEGIAGHCSLTIVNDEGDSLYQVCTYQRPCKPFHVQVCPAGEVCDIQDHLGTSSCVDLFLPDGGNGAEGAECAASNSCADGLTCLSLGTGDDGGDDSDDVFTCFYECIVAGYSVPFDAGPNGAPGYGGCPAGELCNTLDSTASPPWLGYCAAP
jgi:hypothetical protein